MPKSSQQKKKLLVLLRMFEEKTDENNGITVPEIIAHLNRYGIEAERKSVYDDINTLKETGYDIVSQKIGKAVSYSYIGRTFELAELKLLADAVSASKFITEKKSDVLISKISTLTSQANAKTLKRQVFVRNRVKTRNEKIYYNIDTLHRAISSGMQVTFKYYEYTTDKDENNQPKRKLKGGIKERTASPLALCWDDENYYLVAYYEKYSRLTHFRVDKMDSIVITDNRNIVSATAIDMAAYAKKTFGMFPGEEVAVKLKVENDLLDVIFDKFGKDARIIKCDDEHFCTTVSVAVSPPFFGWLFQFNGKITIVEPQSLITELKRYARLVAKQYK